MYTLLIRLMVLAALADLIGRPTSEFIHESLSLQTLERFGRDVTTIVWKPISVFPDEASKFKE